jgi:hypothetical protein
MNKILYNKFTFIFLSIIAFVLLSSFIYKIIVAQPVNPYVDNKNDEFYSKQIQLNILNACGESGVAAKFKEYYRIKEFDVVEIGNYNKELDKSIVIDRIGDLRSAYKIAQIAGISDTLVVSSIDSTMYLRTTLVIGKDWRELDIFN